jgi:hypothetical protein
MRIYDRMMLTHALHLLLHPERVPEECPPPSVLRNHPRSLQAVRCCISIYWHIRLMTTTSQGRVFLVGPPVLSCKYGQALNFPNFPPAIQKHLVAEAYNGCFRFET